MPRKNLVGRILSDNGDRERLGSVLPTVPVVASADAVNMTAPARLSQTELDALIAKREEWA